MFPCYRNPTLLKDILERKGMFTNSHMAITQPSSDKTPIKLPEVVLSVLIFHPFKVRSQFHELVNSICLGNLEMENLVLCWVV